MPTYLEPFDLQTILVDYFLGGQTLFAYAFVIMMAYVCAKYQLPDRYFLLLLAISSLLFSIYIGEALLIVILVVIGLVSFKSLAGLLNK